jgi:hypothetical protein
MRILLSAALIGLLLASRADAAPPPPVHLPPIEGGAGVSAEHKVFGLAGYVDGNLTKHFALASEVTATPEGVGLLGGARVSTGYYFDGTSPGPGRFFAQIMAGRQAGPLIGAHTVIQPGAGADIIIGRSHGVALRWSIDYTFVRDASPERSGGRFLFGILLGPRL